MLSAFIPLFENPLITVMMASCPLVVGSSSETLSINTVCHLVSGTKGGCGYLDIDLFLDLAAWHTSQLRI